MGIEKPVIDEIVRRVTSASSPDRIILFGSAVTGDMTPDSDIDLLVLENAPGDCRTESVRLHEALRGMGHPFDIIVMPTSWFEESKNVIGGIAFPANKHGKVLYAVA